MKIKPFLTRTLVATGLIIFLTSTTFAQFNEDNLQGNPGDLLAQSRPPGPVPVRPTPARPIPVRPPRPIPPQPRPPYGWHGDYYYNPYTGAVSTIWVAGYLMMNAAYAQQQQAIMSGPVYYYHPQTGEVGSKPRFGWVEVHKNQQMGTVMTQTVEKTQTSTDAAGNTTTTTTTTTTTQPLMELPQSTAYPSTLY